MEKLAIKDKGNVTTVTVIGDIEFDDAMEINETIKEVINKGKVKMVFDLKGCSYVDSSGLGALVEANKQCHAGGGDLRLCNVCSDFKDVLVMTRTIKYFQIFNDINDAVASFN